MSDKKLWDQYVAMEKERDALLAENEALAANLRGKHSTTGATYAHLIEDRDELRAKVEEMERQEPVAWMQSTHLSSFKNRLCGSQSSYVHCSDHQLHPDFKPLYALPGAAPEPSESEARMRWLLRQIVHALPSRRDWLDPAIEREARIATTPGANHDPR